MDWIVYYFLVRQQHFINRVDNAICSQHVKQFCVIAQIRSSVADQNKVFLMFMSIRF